MAITVAELVAKISGDDLDFQQKVQKSDSAFRGLAQSVGSTASQMSKSVSGFARDIAQGFNQIEVLTRLAGQAFDALELGATGLDLRDTLQAQLGGAARSVDQYVAAMDRAAGDTLSDFQLMELASGALANGVQASASEMAQGLEIARGTARETGKDVVQVFNEMTADSGKWARAIAKGADDASSAVHSMGDSHVDTLRRVQAELDNAKRKWLEVITVAHTQGIGDAPGLAKVATDAAEAAARFLAAHNALQAVHGDMSETAGLLELLGFRANLWMRNNEGAIAILQQYPDVLTVFNAELARQNDAFGVATTSSMDFASAMSYQQGVFYANEAAAYANASALRDQAMATQEATDQLYGLNPELNLAANYSQAAGDQATYVAAEIAKIGPEAFASADGLAALKAELLAVIAAAPLAADAANRAIGAIRTLQQLRVDRPELWDPKYNTNTPSEMRASKNPDFAYREYEQAQKVIEVSRERDIREWYAEWQRLQRQLANSGTGTARSVGAAHKAAADDSAKKWEQAMKRATQQAQSLWDKALGEIRSAADQALQLDLSVSDSQMLMAQYGMYEDQASENLRRLADVVNRGEESPWKDYFERLRGLYGEELRATAAYMLEQGERWLDPSLIDFDAALQRARENLIAARNKEDFRARIEQALIDEGHALEEVRRSLAQEMGATPMPFDIALTPELELDKAALLAQVESLLEDDQVREALTRASKAVGSIVTEAGTAAVTSFDDSLRDTAEGIVQDLNPALATLGDEKLVLVNDAFVALDKTVVAFHEHFNAMVNSIEGFTPPAWMTQEATPGTSTTTATTEGATPVSPPASLSVLTFKAAPPPPPVTLVPPMGTAQQQVFSSSTSDRQVRALLGETVGLLQATVAKLDRIGRGIEQSGNLYLDGEKVSRKVGSITAARLDRERRS